MAILTTKFISPVINLQRTKAQLKLLQDMESHFEEMKDIAKTAFLDKA
jgi:hypothetical protein